MHDTERIRKGIFIIRYNNEVDMIIHKTVRQDGEAEFSAIIGHERKVTSPVGIIKKYILPVIASLGNVMGVFRND